MTVVNKTDLIEKVKASVPNKDVVSNASLKRIVDAVFDSIKGEVVAGNEVLIKNFGTFKTVDRAEREARNIKTGELIKVPAHKSVKFSAGSDFKKSVN